MERDSSYSADYFERALRKAYSCEKLCVENFRIESVNQSGENFCSVIYRIALEFRRTPDGALESGKYILKDLLPMLAERGTSEKYMFEYLLPAMSTILRNSNPELEEQKLSADCLLAESSAGKEIYILEDLGALGYVSFDRIQGLNMEEAKICLQKMAQFHGASMVLFQNHPELVAKLPPAHDAQGLTDPFSKVIILDGAEYVADAFAKELPEISKKIKAQIPETYSQRIQNVVDPKKSKFNAIVHGDLWLNNMMVDRNNKKAILVDFQNCFWGSPAIDLQLFFYTSIQQELLSQQEDLLKHYFHYLHETLSHCGFRESLPTFDQLKDEMHRCLFYAYYAVTCELPICCASPEASADFNVHTFLDSDAMNRKRRQLFSSDRVWSTIKASLLEFDQQGILETP